MVKGAVRPRYPEILSEDALAFLADLHRAFRAAPQELLGARAARQNASTPANCRISCPRPQWIRDAHWKIAPIPADLADRRVEITGPVDRKMIVNALNSGANVFMADFEDANSPTWANNHRRPDQPEGPLGRQDRLHRSGRPARPIGSSHKPAVLIVRPRGWHLRGRACDRRRRAGLGRAVRFRRFISSTIAARSRPRAPAPYFYLPKLESHRKRGCGTTCSCMRRTRSACQHGTIKATVLIETLPAAFEMDEIL